VAHNGDGFDLPWLKTRCIFHGLPTFPTYKTVDTLQWARRKFYFNSNRLDYIAKFLGLGGKIKTEFGLWKKIVLHRDAAALKQMADYCKRDVALLQQVYARIAPHVPCKTHAGVSMGRDKWSCARCGGKRVKKKMTRITALGTKQHQMQCNDCGGIYTISEPAWRDYQEAKKPRLGK
jgi:DNA polymerase III epsilon subunit-like protein